MGRRVGPKNKKRRNSSIFDGIKSWNLDLSNVGWIGTVISRSGLVILTVLVGLLVYDFYRFGMSSPRFDIELRIQGNDRVAENAIREKLNPYLNRGNGHRSLLSVSASEVKTTLEQQIPRFKSVEVLRRFPNQLVVNVRERVPVAIVARYIEQGNRRIFLPADRKGVTFQPRPGERSHLKDSLPVVLGLEEQSLQSEEYQRQWNRVMRVMKAYQKEFVIEMLNWIRVRPGGYVNIEIEKTRPLVIKLGKDQFRRKLEHLKKMMMTEKFRSVEEYVNMRELDEIFVN